LLFLFFPISQDQEGRKVIPEETELHASKTTVNLGEEKAESPQQQQQPQQQANGNGKSPPQQQDDEKSDAT